MFTKKDALQRLFLCPYSFLAYSFLVCITVSSAALADITEPDCSSKQFDEISKIRYIHDGDTLHLIDGRKIRLIGINTPELARDRKPAEAYGIEARNALKSLFKNDKSIALVYGKDNKDRYGRLLAHAHLTDGQNAQAALLKLGYARVITVPPNTQMASCYLEIEHKARCENVGLWQNEKILQANRLDNQHIGFHLVQGKVESIINNKKGLWLNLDNRLTVGIRKTNLSLFDIKTINKMLNQSVIVRGWLNKNNKSTPFYLRVRHPLSIQLATAYNCQQ
jgi:endonuclease YncB( thermonuclease family)